jgi:hypothetical protein
LLGTPDEVNNHAHSTDVLVVRGDFAPAGFGGSDGANAAPTIAIPGDLHRGCGTGR